MRPLWLWTAFAAIAPLSTAAEMPVGFFRGSFASFQGTAASGVFEASNEQGTTESCGYDSRSYFERAHERVTLAKLAPGDPIEVLADHKPGSKTCYARIVHVLDIRPAILPRPPRPVPPASIPLSGPLARGDRSVAGLVMRRESNALWIKARTGDQVVMLRPDTRYLDDGVRVDAAAVPLNWRVYVRAGRNIYGEIEAYQVVWGTILTVR